MNIQLEFTPWQVEFLIKIMRNYLKIRKKKYNDYNSGLKSFNYHPEAIFLQGAIIWLQDNLAKAGTDEDR